ncbi:probable cytochrome P450 4aa1 isoform X3 [Coccinella septempunctata]|uniref:probable cytochrome P450 4aa1 isoform X3 n=1 Tax=Coccinella septempunctata TaxID=41139 RepID=UPI001D0697C4|nr:probable cytochrome P450 4aa1 isoform X3 [Coccinella septempunctata]
MTSSSHEFFFNTIYLLCLLYLLWRLRNYFRAVFLAFNLPGPHAHPLIGNALTVRDNRKLEYYGNNAHKLFGPIFRSWISIVPFFFVTDPAHLQTLLSNGRLTKKNMFYTLLHNFIGEGLITNNGTVLGISMTDDDYKNSPFRKGELIVPYRISRPWMLIDCIFSFTNSADKEKRQRTNLHEFTKRVLDAQRKQPASATSKFVSLIEVFMNISEANPEFTEQDVIDETCTFMLAGQDSVGAATAFTLHFLAKHEDVQKKVYEEQFRIFENDCRLVTTKDLSEMRYLEQCIKETMRLCPSVPIICRKLNEDVRLGKYVLPKETNVFISPFITHRLEYLYPEPQKYNPDRFSTENSHNIHPYGYIPFSAGPRNCIGYKFAMLEMKAAISSIIREYHLSLVEGKKETVFSYRITLRCKGGIWIKFTRRNKK